MVVAAQAGSSFKTPVACVRGEGGGDRRERCRIPETGASGRSGRVARGHRGASFLPGMIGTGLARRPYTESA
ncbi:hypothetical protein MTO96_005012 [Rhipicephalus appendiculatus]